MRVVKIGLIALLLAVTSVQCWALQIVAPKEGDIVEAGAQFSLRIKPDQNEEWLHVVYGLSELSYNPLFGEYRETVRIPKELFGQKELLVVAIDKFGKETRLKRTVFVKLPLNVVLQSIEVNPSFILLEKMPAGSAPDDVSAYSTKKLRVNGIYSDAVKRKLSSSAAGTTYVSGNDKVATVDTEGLITAQDIGETTITVRNGKYSTTVKVIVKPYK